MRIRPTGTVFQKLQKKLSLVVIDSLELSKQESDLSRSFTERLEHE